MATPNDIPDIGPITPQPAPGLLESAPVPLLIRSPSLGRDHKLAVDPDTRIGELKRRLEVELPQKPKAEDIRVIFAGRLVGDAESVGGMRQGRDPALDLVLHVVIRPGATLAKLSGEHSQASSVAAEQTAEPPAVQQASSAPASELRHRHVAQSQSAPVTTAPSTPTYPESWAQYPYLYQPMVINGAAYYVPVPNPTYVGSAFPTSYAGGQIPTSPAVAIPAAVPVVEPQAAAPAPAPAPAVQPALPPPEPDPMDIPPEEQENGLSLLLRLAFLVYLFSQNAPFGRVVAMHVVAAIIWFWRTGRLRALRGGWIRRAGPGRGLVPQQPEAVPGIAAVPAHGQGQQRGVEGAEGQPAGDQPQQPQPPQRNLLQNVGNIAYTFVASLIPQDVQAN